MFPPERVHYFSMNSLRLLRQVGLGGLISAMFKHKKRNTETHFTGLDFPNPVGLGAGFDKNAKYLPELELLGFGFVEIGTVTPIAQKGNDKPRLFRLAKDKALVNRMGFNNDGVKAVAARMKQWRTTHSGKKENRIIVGGNIGKNKVTANEDAWKDYETCFKELHPYVDYFVVNVSSPNTPGLRELQEKASLQKILRHLQMINNGKASARPIFLKIAPDLNKSQVDDVIDLAMEIKLDGLVVSNTTISREGLQTPLPQIERIGAGGLSGAPLLKSSTELLKYICSKTTGHVPVIASGGIFTAADAKEKFDAGAGLVQVWTGFIYEGPSIVKKICKGLQS
jgi:dihydroorotate dehydrogenase